MLIWDHSFPDVTHARVAAKGYQNEEILKFVCFRLLISEPHCACKYYAPIKKFCLIWQWRSAPNPLDFPCKSLTVFYYFGKRDFTGTDFRIFHCFLKFLDVTPGKINLATLRIPAFNNLLHFCRHIIFLLKLS